MNAKKIMGAVLVALLAAALFVGAGAAAEEEGLGTVFLYQKGLDPTVYDGTYSCGDSTVIIDNGVVSTTDVKAFVNGGKYTTGSQYVIVKLPNAGFTAVGETEDDEYDAMAEGLVSGQAVTFQAVPEAEGNFVFDKIVIFNPKGEPTVFTDVGDGELALDTVASANAFPVKGTYKIQAIFNKTQSDLAGITPASYLEGKLYEFTVFSAEGELSASADTVIVNNAITVTITGAPGATFVLDTAGKFIFDEENQPAGVEDLGQIVLPNDGKVTIYLIAGTDDGKQTITLYNADETKKIDSVIVTIVEGTITAVSEEDSYFVGNPIKISGTTTAGTPLFFYLEGTNLKFGEISVETYEETAEYNADGTWSVELDSAISQAIGNGEYKPLVAGTYTVLVATESGLDTKKELMEGAYATVAVTLKQPFLTDIKAAAVAIQGSEYKVTGIAEAAKEVRLYVFGTNFFVAFQDKGLEDGAFEFKFDIIDEADEDGYMAPGTYFYLIQHPMNDGNFNVWNGTGFGDWEELGTDGNFYYAATNAAGDVEFVDDALVFNVWKRGTNYAAQALLEEIAGQNIDDTFVQGTFEVEAQKLVINPIPAEVTKGSKLAVSGTTNSGEGVEVIVNVLAGTFGATVKGDENGAIFITQKAVTNEDGTFEAAIDTSKLPLGNYIVTVEIDATPYDSAAVKIVDAEPVTPVDPVDPVDPKPVDPVTPTEPETPGFGALAALAGLGAVAVLLLRRE